MNENKTAQIDATDENSKYCCSSLTPRQMLAARVRDISYHVSDMDRCVLCKAAEELDKPKDSGANWALKMLALMFAGTPCGGDGIDPDGLKAYMDAVEKKKTADT